MAADNPGRQGVLGQVRVIAEVITEVHDAGVLDAVRPRGQQGQTHVGRQPAARIHRRARRRLARLCVAEVERSQRP